MVRMRITTAALLMFAGITPSWAQDCHSSRAGSICVTETVNGLNRETRFVLSLDPGDAIRELKRKGIDPTIGHGCRFYANEPAAQSDPVFTKLTPRQRDTLKQTILVERDQGTDKRINCTLSATEVVGSPGQYFANPIVKSGLTGCLPDIVARVNELGYRVQRQTVEVVSLDAKSKALEELESLSLSCSYGTRTSGMFLFFSVNGCKTANDGLANEAASLMGASGPAHTTLVSTIKNAAQKAFKARADDRPTQLKRNGYVVDAVLVPATRAFACSHSITIFSERK